VKNWPHPLNVTEIRSFLGFATYYRRFIPHFSTVASPMTALTRKDVVFDWSEECELAFRRLKGSLMSAPVLAYPRQQGQLILDTDASNTGIGAVLSQIQEGEEKVLGYASKTLSKSERAYCTTYKELLAVVKFCKHFKPYLWGQPVIIRTDHASLTWLKNFKEPENMLARWLSTLNSYDLTIIHRPGVRHINADVLSRRVPNRPCPRRDCPCCKELLEARDRQITVVKTRPFGRTPRVGKPGKRVSGSAVVLCDAATSPEPPRVRLDGGPVPLSSKPSVAGVGRVAKAQVKLNEMGGDYSSDSDFENESDNFSEGSVDDDTEIELDYDDMSDGDFHGADVDWDSDVSDLQLLDIEVSPSMIQSPTDNDSKKVLEGETAVKEVLISAAEVPFPLPRRKVKVRPEGFQRRSRRRQKTKGTVSLRVCGENHEIDNDEGESSTTVPLAKVESCQNRES
jgi:hypothetical protein